MLELHFSGWFQCRLATGPTDPVDEPRGVSGWTFSVGNEPDLDRIVRFQNPVAPRSHAPPVGVFVTRVVINDVIAGADHPLVGAEVDLLDDPIIVGRNGIFFEAVEEPLDPFNLRIRKEGVVIQRNDQVSNNGRRVEDVFGADVGIGERDFKNPRFDYPDLQRRLPVGAAAFSPEVTDATGVHEFARHRQERAKLLKQDLEATTDPDEKAALEKRVRELEINDRRIRQRELGLGLQLKYDFGMNGPATVTDPENALKGKASTSPQVPWPIRFWLGGWDADALAGFVKGALQIPFRADD